MHNLTLNETADFLRRHNDYTILTHRRPDGDTVGSAVALCRALRKLGKRAAIFENPQFTPRYLPYLQGLTTAQVSACVISVDIAAEGLFPFGYDGPVQLCIDHHGSNSGFAVCGLVEAQRAACGEILFALLRALQAPIDPVTASALYIAIATDCGCFRYSNTTPDTLRAAAELMELGADTQSINREFFEVKTRARLALESYLADGLRLFGGGKIGICRLPEQEKLRLGVTEDDADSIAGFARNLEGVQIGVMLRDLSPTSCKISLRTDDRYFDASAICRLLGGGGHSAAAGATVPGTLQSGQAAILQAIHTATGLPIQEDA